MADITMCSQSLCPNAGHCYRATATPSLHWQSVQAFNYTVSSKGVICGSYWPTHKTVMSNSTAKDQP